MKADMKETTCDLMIIGTGMAGMAAALFAAQSGVDTVQAGMVGEINFASGLLDLLGVHPVENRRALDNPWQGLERLRRDEPLHPYARVTDDTIRTAFKTVTAFLEAHGYPHHYVPDKNLTIITPAGTVKPTYAVPHTMAYGATAFADKLPCLLVDFRGLKGYSTRQIAGSLIARWPDLRTVHLDFPGLDGSAELYTEQMARALDLDQTRQQLVAAIQPHLASAQAVGLPAILGMYRTRQTMDAIQQGLGVPVFEIPTMVPAVTGLRLREIFEQNLPKLGVRPFYNRRVLAVKRMPDGTWTFDLGRNETEIRVTAGSAVLCSGRFFGKGLHADRQGIRETIFNLPVVQPEGRTTWHHKDLMHVQGHPLNRAGVAVDDHFRPLDASGQVLYDNLYAAGTILAHQDWIRQKCGSGLAMATALGAITACKKGFGGA